MQKKWFRVDFNNNYDDVTHTDAATPGDSEDMRECECVLVLPDCYTETSEAVPLILSSHGAGGRVCREEDKTGGLSYVTPCIEAGYAAFDIHGTRPDGNSIGNRRYLEAAHRAYVYVLRRYNVQEGLFVQNRYPYSGKILCEKCGKRYKRKVVQGRLYWQCSTFLHEGRDACPAQQIPERILDGFTAELGGMGNISKIIVPESNHLIFRLVSGAEVEHEWSISRRDSWTDEMKEAARQRAREQHGN